MINRHVSTLLVAYLHNELTEGEKLRVCRHLKSCEQCREEYRELASVHRALKFMPEAAVSTEITRKPPRYWNYTSVAAVATVLVLAVWLWYTPDRPLTVAKLQGSPLLEGKPVVEIGRFEPGQCIQTDGRSAAQIDLEGKGHVNVKPNSEVQLVQAQPNERRLKLMKGMIEAFVSTPPRMFVVETPTATAVDMGCAYTLATESDGATRLHVRLGFVILQSKVMTSIVPEGASCRSEAKIGVGTPIFDDASPDFRDAVQRLDRNNFDELALSQTVAGARKEDALTLWHLVPRIPPYNRTALIQALRRMVPLPEGTTAKEMSSLNPATLRKWRDAILPSAKALN
ncbi:FecR domain-containing protein [Fimbriimonas ginsengisoli]|uniref:FecR protein domain-containing protein n=1 Tax=Fimbriimonas ginsengisoli Gsoil 348 TaxID=661478 RepID=A0A068NMT0_FIMGI|nr:FecR domain-containing protein [Fimbriimonas ginsengisoli]AIE84040.1 hypothetical protein OP10G_0672 [Fimbriimonas ginsengisoli Gsoil 348]